MSELDLGPRKVPPLFTPLSPGQLSALSRLTGSYVEINSGESVGWLSTGARFAELIATDGGNSKGEVSERP